VDGTDVWVANMGGLTELNAATGAPIRVVTGPSYEFDDPSAIAADGAHLWVANSGADSVTELPASPQ
jgi:DNA-binding beta-propeller fold protein YncE